MYLFLIGEDNCFTMLHWFLLYINVNQPQVCICAPSLLNLPPTCLAIPLPRLSQITGFEVPASQSKFPLVVHCTYDDVYAYVSMLLFHVVPHSPSQSVSTGLFSMFALETDSLVPSFQILHICVNIQYMLFYF